MDIPSDISSLSDDALEERLRANGYDGPIFLRTDQSRNLFRRELARRLDPGFDKAESAGGSGDSSSGQQETKSVESMPLVEAEVDDCFYGIFLPGSTESEPSSPAVVRSRAEVLRVLKSNKLARFRKFPSYEEADSFSRHQLNSSGLDLSLTEPRARPSSEPSSPYKGPRIQELVALRKLLEAGRVDKAYSPRASLASVESAGDDGSPALGDGSFARSAGRRRSVRLARRVSETTRCEEDNYAFF